MIRPCSTAETMLAIDGVVGVDLSSPTGPGEELQIAIFLSNMRKEVLEVAVGELSKIVVEELSNLFNVICTEAQVRWIMQTHVRLVLARRVAYGSTEALNYCLELKDCSELEDFFRLKVDITRQFRDNDVFKMRSAVSEKELLAMLEPMVQTN